MIGKVTRGRDVGGLLRYLFGRGRRNEHIRPHLVAGWDEPAALEPAWSKRPCRHEAVGPGCLSGRCEPPTACWMTA